MRYETHVVQIEEPKLGMGTEEVIFLLIIALLLVVAVVCVVRWAMNKRGNKKAPAQAAMTAASARPASAVQDASAASVPSDSPGEMEFCSQCGAKIPVSSRFCPKCGAMRF